MLPPHPYAFCVIAEVPESSVENYEPEVLECGAKGTALATRLLPPTLPHDRIVPFQPFSLIAYQLSSFLTRAP